MSAPVHIFEKVKNVFLQKTRFLQVCSECSGTHFRRSHQTLTFSKETLHVGSIKVFFSTNIRFFSTTLRVFFYNITVFFLPTIRYHGHDMSTARLLQPRYHCQDTTARNPKPGLHSQRDASWNPQSIDRKQQSGIHSQDYTFCFHSRILVNRSSGSRPGVV